LHLIGIDIPLWLSHDTATAMEKATELNVAAPSFAFNLPAFIITWIITGILIKGIKEAANTNNIIVIIKIAVVLFVIIVGAFYVNPDNWVPFIPAETTTMVDGVPKVNFGFGGVLTAATIVFFAYIGFDAVSTQAGEAINPKRDVPFAIVASLVICTILYILVSLVLTGMVPYSDLDKTAPVADAFFDRGITWATFIITLAATAGLMSVMLVMMLGQTRIFLGMAKDGLLPPFFKNIHQKFKTPHKSTFLVGLIISIVAALTPIEKVSEMCSMGTLLAFAMVCLAVMILRYKKPGLERPYKAPAVYLVGSLGIAFNLFLMYFVRTETWYAFLFWGLLGIIIYFAYSRGRSTLNELNPFK
jgi:APA family basic amino acid/polyamine antiporter